MFPLSNRQLASPYSFDETVELLRAAIIAADMMVLHEIDTQAIVRRGGIEISGVRQLLYFHPRWMKIVVETTPDAVIEAPLKWVIRETPEGTMCNASWPSQTFGRYAGLEAMARELDAIVERIAGAL